MNNFKIEKLYLKNGDEIELVSIDFSRAPNHCELCGKEDELRPYGPECKWVCFDCMMEDEENAIKIFSKIGRPMKQRFRINPKNSSDN